LLDNLLNARVSDFGLSTLASPDLSHISTTVQGTLGYLDPSYYHNFQLTDKSDVYSFGVVLLELVSSQRAIDFSREQDDVNLAIYAKTKSEKGKLLELIDPELIATAAPKIVDTMIGVTLLALNCLEDNRVNRPTMKEVVEELLFIISVEETESDAIPKAIITRSGDGDEDEDPAEPSGHAVEDPEETTAEEVPLSCDSTILDQLSDHCL
jgi:serine/threonine protein kinase